MSKMQTRDQMMLQGMQDHSASLNDEFIGYKSWNHTSIYSAGLIARHEIQQRHQVGLSENVELWCSHFDVVSLSKWVTFVRPLARYNNDFNNNRRNVNANRRPNNRLEMIPTCSLLDLVDRMKTYKNMYPKLCSYENLELAFIKARKRKTQMPYVKQFEADLEENLKRLQTELETETYSPKDLTTFIVRDPKTRKISASHFRDRVVHHAICNIIEPILAKQFIHDSFANQKNKGTHKAILRFEKFIRQVSFKQRGQQNLFQTNYGYALKADIKHYFDTLDQEILLQIIERRIKDRQLLSLIKLVLKNHKGLEQGKGMPLGNLTSQFFANVYLNELDYFVKHELKTKHYLRYVDDFVILHRDLKQLEIWKNQIDQFLKIELKLELHPDKSKIVNVDDGITLLGYRIFPHHRLVKKSNQRRIWQRIERLREAIANEELDFDQACDKLVGFLVYTDFTNNYHLTNKVVAQFTKRGIA